ncbi:hypothetical protein ONA91_03875 [Micromonospora sp. DR5-3]|uniref:hypothetical protein n=1 Tax=unclassified Micromonospora TaxID=2617518 RepID=UPI0011D6C926|nr:MULTISPECIES: hypothetical protein [unclassified Micromonospora]MCW3813598.1 hypothetical protein [Micromonospora sp. DR5-3]TYC25701.1 hypothetical protein FXF52_04615 [Micromonospora sp. MP36]
MTNIDERLASQLHALVDGEPDSAAPTGMLLERGRQARRRRTGSLVSGSLAVLALGAVGAATLVHGPASDRPAVVAEASSPAVASPQMELAAAVAASENTSYRVTVRRTARVDPKWSETTLGAFDPATASGYLRTPFPDGLSFQEDRLVDGVYYLGGADGGRKMPWKRYPGKRNFLPFDAAMGGALGASSDQEGLFQVLKKTGATVTKTGERAYHFSVEPTGKATGFDAGAPLASEKVVGDVTLDADNRVAKLDYEVTYVWKKDGKVGPPTTVQVTMAFSDYGLPVKVEPPAPAEVVR